MLQQAQQDPPALPRKGRAVQPRLEGPGSSRGLTAPWFSACCAAAGPPPLNSCYPPAAAPGISSASAGSKHTQTVSEAAGVGGDPSRLMRTAGSWSTHQL